MTWMMLPSSASEGCERSAPCVCGSNVPVVSISTENAAEHFGWLGGFVAIDSPASSALTSELLGWQPTQLGLIDDLDKGHYFNQQSA